MLERERECGRVPQNAVIFLQDKDSKMNEPIKTPTVETKIDGEEIFRGRVLRLERDRVALPDGKTSVLEVIRHNGAVCVIPYDGEGNVWVVTQYRYAVERMTLEIPAGKLDTKDEVPEEAARRELAEETGFSCDRLIPMGLYLGSPAILDEKIHMYAAVGLHTGHQHLDDDEFLSARRMPLSELADMVMRGEIPDGKTQCAVLRLCRMAEQGML